MCTVVHGHGGASQLVSWCNHLSYSIAFTPSAHRSYAFLLPLMLYMTLQ